MASFNKVVLMGNLTRDPDGRMTGASGLKVARLGLAINERRRDRNGQMQDFPVFVDVDAWDRLAELCGQHLQLNPLVYCSCDFRLHHHLLFFRKYIGFQHIFKQ